MKATQDFEYASIVIKAGEKIQPGTFEADQIWTLLRKGWIVEEAPEPKKEIPAKKAGKGKTK